ncbi:MAG: NAD(P)/FAD-dependent oxidoreductase [Candidatus Thorarchaeota archaeon]
MKYDVIVIGAGPAGLITAHEASKRLDGVLVLEEHEEIGRPDHCAGILSVTGLDSLGLRPPDDVVQNMVNKARIYSPSGYQVEVGRGKSEALVVDRALFDRWLADRAADNGSDIVVGCRVRSVILNGREGNEIVDSQGDRRCASIVIDAEGFRCVLSSRIGLPRVNRLSRLPAYQYEVRGAKLDDDTVEMFYSRRFAPGFFAWLVPLGDGRARVGLASKSRSRIRLDAAMRHHPILSASLKHAKVERGLGGVVLAGLPIRTTYAKGIMIVGDAAGMTKPTTGGGVIYGGIAGRIAGRVAVSAVLAQDTSEERMSDYQRRWRGAMMSELRTMYVAYKFLSSLGDRGMDTLIRNASQSGLVDVVQRHGDMDRQKQVIWRLIREPTAVLSVLSALRFLSPHL